MATTEIPVSSVSVDALEHGSSLRKMFSFPVLMAVCLVAAVVTASMSKLLDPDTWWHVTVGNRILSTHAWPTVDIYSSTAAGTSWIAYEWLGEIIMAIAGRFHGVLGLWLLLVGLSSALTLLLYGYTFQLCGNWKAAFAASALSLTILPAFFTLRPQLMGYIFFLLTLMCLERFRQHGSKIIWSLPLIFLAWANTHGTFVFGFTAILFYWLSGRFHFAWGCLDAEPSTHSQSVTLLTVTILSILSTVITPYGSQIAAYPLSMAILQPTNINNIQEWQSVQQSGAGLHLFMGCVLILITALAVLRPRVTSYLFLLLVVFVYSAAVHLRFLLLFALLFFPILGTLFARWVPAYDRRKDKPIINAVLILILLVLGVKYVPSVQQLRQKITNKYPDKAIVFLREHPAGGTLFNEYGWGGYLIWAATPETKVFIDGRADIYEQAGVLQDYLDITSLKRNTDFLLAKYKVSTCLVERESALATYLSASSQWREVYRDDISSLFVQSRLSQATK
jgi:hypothetical protein